MALMVIYDRGNKTEVIKDAETWTVDDRGFLWLYGKDAEGVPVASFSAIDWTGVKTVESK